MLLSATQVPPAVLDLQRSIKQVFDPEIVVDVVDSFAFGEEGKSSGKKRTEETNNRLGGAGVRGHLSGVALKGHEIAIQALTCLPEATLLIVGQGPRETALRSLVSSLGLDERVYFLGTIEHSRLREVYSSADILLLPSSSEGMANVLLEAMACGAPVVGTRVGAFEDLIEPEKTGYLIDVEDIDAMTRYVSDLVSDADKREAFGAASRARALRSPITTMRAFGSASRIPLTSRPTTRACSVRWVSVCRRGGCTAPHSESSPLLELRWRAMA